MFQEVFFEKTVFKLGPKKMKTSQTQKWVKKRKDKITGAIITEVIKCLALSKDQGTGNPQGEEIPGLGTTS